MHLKNQRIIEPGFDRELIGYVGGAAFLVEGILRLVNENKNNIQS